MAATVARVRFPQIHDLDSYIRVVRRIEGAIAKGCGELVLDFSRTEKAYPDGMTPLIASIARLRAIADFEVVLVLPTDRQLNGVFDGVGWTQYLTIRKPHFEKVPTRTRVFTPVRPFENDDDLQQLHRSIMDVLVSQTQLETDLPEAMEWALWEVMDNVLRHSEVGMGWVQASAFPKTKHINIVVVDHGIGIQESLSQAFPGVSERAALSKAVEQGVTRDPEVGAGWGLRGCRQIVRINRGAMTLYSGGTRFDEHIQVSGWGASRTERQIGVYKAAGAIHSGTLVELELRTDRPVDLAEALGGRRPPSLIEMLHAVGPELAFDVAAEATNLGTRDSGRRLRLKVENLSRSESDDRIVLDFSAVEMVSSSFADELVAKLVAKLGRDGFEDRFELRNLNPSVNTVVQLAIWGRVK